jgi:thymidine kinase
VDFLTSSTSSNVDANLGWIEAICGPMFSGKSEELIRRLRRAVIARKRVQVFKPSVDTRYSEREIATHAHVRMASNPWLARPRSWLN